MHDGGVMRWDKAGVGSVPVRGLRHNIPQQTGVSTQGLYTYAMTLTRFSLYTSAWDSTRIKGV